MKQSKKIIHLFGIFIMLIIYQSCSPVFSELQSARTVGKDRIDITPAFTSVYFNEDSETEKAYNHLGLQAAYGITSAIDIRLRYEYVWSSEDEDGGSISVIGIGPKFSLLKDKIAFYVPIGRALGEETNDTWQLHPTVLFTLPAIKEKLDINLSSKYLLGLSKDAGLDNSIAVNLGLAISSNIQKWAIRPEYGVLFFLEEFGEKQFFSHFSLGFTTFIK